MQVIIAELADIEREQAAQADAELADRPAASQPKPHDKRPSAAGRGTSVQRRNIPQPQPPPRD